MLLLYIDTLTSDQVSLHIEELRNRYKMTTYVAIVITVTYDVLKRTYIAYATKILDVWAMIIRNTAFPAQTNAMKTSALLDQSTDTKPTSITVQLPKSTQIY